MMLQFQVFLEMSLVNQRGWTLEQMEVSCPTDCTVLHLYWALSPAIIKKQNTFFSGLLYVTEPNSWTIYIVVTAPKHLAFEVHMWMGVQLHTFKTVVPHGEPQSATLSSEHLI
jgi:hypothetical protein